MISFAVEFFHPNFQKMQFFFIHFDVAFMKISSKGTTQSSTVKEGHIASNLSLKWSLVFSKFLQIFSKFSINR
jgi:hypothetical protein